MDRIAGMASADRADLMRLVSDRRKALSPAVVEKDFWEKITILHHEAHRPEGNSQPDGYSRH